jgi:hypothetical protein
VGRPAERLEGKDGHKEGDGRAEDEADGLPTTLEPFLFGGEDSEAGGVHGRFSAFPDGADEEGVASLEEEQAVEA